MSFFEKLTKRAKEIAPWIEMCWNDGRFTGHLSYFHFHTVILNILECFILSSPETLSILKWPQLGGFISAPNSSYQRWPSKDSLLCVGLDPHKSELEEDSAEAAFRFCRRLIEDRFPLASMIVKMNDCDT